MEIAQLRAIREFRDRGTIAAAANALHVTPSAISQQLSSLQREHHGALFERHGRSLQLTPTGRRLAEAADEVLVALERARLVAESDSSDQSVSITAIHSLGLVWFGELVTRAATAGIDLSCRDEDVAIEAFPGLAADYDLVLAHRPSGTQPWPTDAVTVIPLMREPLRLALAADHPLAAQSHIRVSDLVHENWIAVHAGFTLDPLLAALAEAATQPVQIRHRINEFHVASAIVATGSAVCLLPAETGLPKAMSNQVVLRDIDDLNIERHIEVLARPDALIRPAVQTALEWLQEIASRLSH